MSVTRAYKELLHRRKSNTVIVAVVDSGIDISHEDLKGKIWKNPKEKLNGKDDDGNGYIDDINGWNFLGDIVAENMEFVRIIRDNQLRFEGVDPTSFSGKDKENYDLYKSARIEYEKEVAENKQKLQQYRSLYEQVVQSHDFATKQFGKPTYSSKDLFGMIAENEQERTYKLILMQMYGNVGKDETMEN